MSDGALRQRGARQRWAAPGGSHDRLIAVLQALLPVAIGVLAAFLVMAPLTAGGDASFVLDKNKVEVAKERLKVRAADYRGEDAKGQPFELRAGSAVQKSSSEPVVRIDRLDARIGLEDGPATLTAPAARYDMSAERLATEGPIRFQAADGYRLDTRDATVDLKTRRLASGGAVTGTLPIGNFSANHMRADLAARTVTLEGRARLRIEQNRARGRR